MNLKRINLYEFEQAVENVWKCHTQNRTNKVAKKILRGKNLKYIYIYILYLSKMDW